MNNHGTLLRLERIVTARGHQAIDDVIEGVVVVVVQGQTPFRIKKHIRQDVFLRFNCTCTDGWANHGMGRIS